MTDKLAAGASVTRTFEIDAARTIDFLGEELRVYATPAMIQDAEITCRDFLLEHALDGIDSVGTGISMSHTAASPLGMTVTFTATVTKAEGPLVEFDVVAHDGLEEVGRGKHGRFMVPVDKLAERIKSKIAKFKNG